MESFVAGANGVVLYLSGETKFDIAYQMNASDTKVGDTFNVYMSVDGALWETKNLTCVVDEWKRCNFSSQEI
jgi:hypothetical protein